MQLAGPMLTSSSHRMLTAISGPNVNVQQSQEAYRNWASTYEQDAETYRFNSYMKVAGILQDLYPEDQRGNIRILDVGAGTGLVAKELKKYGFQHIDALEPCEAMMNEAKKHNRYVNYFSEFISGSPSSIPANTYDVLTGSGIFENEAHVRCEALYEMIRLVKSGGFVVIVINYNQVRNEKHYKDLEPLMGRLETEGKWKNVLRENWMSGSINNIEFERIAWCYKVL